MALCLQSQVAVHQWSVNPNICIPHRTPTLLTTTHFTLRFLLKRPQCQGGSDHLYNEDTSESKNQVTRGTRVVSFPTCLPHCFQFSCFLSALSFFHVFLHERFKYFASATSDECINIHVQTEDCPKECGMGCAERMRKPIIPHHQKCTMLVCTKSCYFFLLPGYYALVKTGLRPLLCSLALSLWWIWMTYNGIWNKGLAISCSSNSLILIVILCSMLYA